MKYPLSRLSRSQCKWQYSPSCLPFSSSVSFSLFTESKYVKSAWWNQKCRSWPHNWDQLRQQTRIPGRIREEGTTAFLYLHACPRVISGFLFLWRKNRTRQCAFPTWIRYVTIDVRVHENDNDIFPSLCDFFLSILLKNSRVLSNTHNSTIFHNSSVDFYFCCQLYKLTFSMII